MIRDLPLSVMTIEYSKVLQKIFSLPFTRLHETELNLGLKLRMEMLILSSINQIVSKLTVSDDHR
ncbi:hypothetical protein ASF44_21490 [Pseudorhodoferax sp. Leaf274]|nr:hypothetical protein ASF44_21490 [Pseudorhodoferax sp. Leaf274]